MFANCIDQLLLAAIRGWQRQLVMPPIPLKRRHVQPVEVYPLHRRRHLPRALLLGHILEFCAVCPERC